MGPLLINLMLATLIAKAPALRHVIILLTGSPQAEPTCFSASSSEPSSPARWKSSESRLTALTQSTQHSSCAPLAQGFLS